METMKLQKRMPVSAMLDPKVVGPAITSAFVKLDPRLMMKNPVMFVVEVVAALTTVIFLRDLVTGGEHLGFTFQIILWLWFTVLFANFAEAVAEGRGKAQAESLRKTRTESQAKLLTGSDKAYRLVPGTGLKVGDVVIVEAGDTIPSDGEVIEGIASVNEAAITGESAPVIRESGGDRSAVTGGTQVLSDWIKVRITAAPGSTFIDRMIKLVEGAERQKTPNEIALNILLVGLTIIFVFATATIPSYVAYASGAVSVVVLIALFVTLIPTTIGALLSAIGIAGMDRLVRFNVLAMSARAVEAAGDVHTLLLDKTGTITLGNRQATEFLPLPGVSESQLADAAQLSSLADETPEGRSVVVLAKDRYGIRGRDMADKGAVFVPFTAQTRMSGVDLNGRQIRKGAADSIERDGQNTSGEGSRQHGRPRLQSDQAHRHRRDRQATPDDSRRADHVLDCQRRGEILRDHSRDVRRGISGADRAQRHGAEDAAIGHPLRRHLQRAHHRRAGPAGSPRRELQADGGGSAAAAQPADLRRRRAGRTVRGHQDHRRDHYDTEAGINLIQNLRIAVLMTVVTTLLLGVAYPLVVTGLAQALFRDKANGQLVERNGQLIGSRIIGQAFATAGYFHVRPSAAGNGSIT